MDDKDYTKASSRWLLEMNFLNNGYVKNALYANVYNADPSILNAELLVDQHNKRILILLELSFWGRFRKKEDEIAEKVIILLKDALPSYEMRVIYDKALFEKATRLLNPSPPVSEDTAKEETPEEDDTEEVT